MEYLAEHRVKKRLLIVAVIVILCFAAVVCRLAYLQIISAGAITARGSGQWTRGVPMTGMRGDIVDRNGVILADSDIVYTLYVRPNAMKDLEAASFAISEVLGLDRAEVKSKISKKGVSEITVAKKLTKNQMLSMAERNIDGVYFGEESVRYFPYGDFMSQVIGFTNADNVGQSGVEQYYDRYLKGINGKLLTETDLVGKELEGSVKRYLPGINGMTTKLTVDYRIQGFAERAVRDAMVSYSAKGATCLILNSNTGAVYAMAQAPSFDLNNVPRDDVNALFEMSKNQMITNVYEPGSTFKILTSAIGLENNAYNTSHRFYCNGARMVDGQRIKCWQSKGHGSQTFEEGVRNSCNCVFMDIATKLGPAVMYDYFRKFGIDGKTGIDMLGEANGLLLKQSNVKNVDIARIGFGQAIAVTPIGLAGAVSACINGGKTITPHVMDSISDSMFGLVASPNIAPSKRVISESTSKTLREYLYGVVEKGSGKRAYVPGYKIGGKTGTAQKYENGSIARGKYISSFIGFSEVDGEEMVCLMIVDEPQGYQYYGSLVAAPYVGEIFRNIFAYKNVQPRYTADEMNTVGKTVAMPNIMNMNVKEATDLLRSLGIEYEYTGEGDRVTYQMPSPGAICKYNTVAFFMAG